MMTHINPKIGLAYLEGRLDGAQQAQIERHLADCPACHSQLLEHQTAHDLLQAAGQDFSPEPARIPNWSDVKGEAVNRPLWRTIFQYGGQLSMAGAALVLLLIFIWQLRPQEPILELAPSVTATGQPISEATPQATGLPSPAVIIIPGLDPTAAAPEITAEPTPDTTVIGTPTIAGENISAVSVSQQGRAAFVVDGTLFVETAANSGRFSAIADHAQPRPPAWSADGQEMLFFRKADDSELPVLIHWTAETGQLTPLSDLIDRPLPEVSFRNVHWAANGREILLPAFGKLTQDSEWDSSVWLADLDTGHMTLVVESIALKSVQWLNADDFMMTLDCGIDCTIIMAFDKAKTLLWKAYLDRPEREAASDLFVVQPAQARILLLNTFDQPQTVDVLNTATGAITPILELDDGMQFGGHLPYLAADGRILLFQVVDEDGQSAIQTLHLEDGTTGTVALQHGQFTFGGGAWDAAGNYFIYSVTDQTIGAAYVYLWQPGNNRTELIQATASEAHFQNFSWTADGRYVYYNLGNRELWQYDVVTGELRAVAGA
jgi:anti-sigma factor RsiW